MATRFYFHAANNALSGTFPTTEQSTLTAAANSDAQTVNRSMDTSIGSGGTSLSISSTNSTRTLYYTKFVSPLIYQTSIAANTWVYGFGANEASLSCNFPVSGTNQTVYVNIYVWQPSSGTKIGTIRDGITAATVDEQGTAGGSGVGHVVNVTGSAVAGLTSGDAVIIFEVWFQNVASIIAGNAENFYFDGATTVVENAAGASTAASYIETPETISLSLAGNAITRSLTQTVTVSESATRLAAKIRTKTETITIGETPARLVANKRALPTQTVAITDTNLVRIKGKVVAPATQTIAVAEASLTRLAAKTRAPATQTITVSEALTRLATKIRALAVQTVTVSESLTKQSAKKRAPTATENIIVSEGLARRAIKSKALPVQTITVSESLTRIKGVLRLATQTVTVTDAIIRIVAKTRAPATQTITVSESLTRLLTKIRALPTQAIVISDAIARTVVHVGGNNIVRAVPTETITVAVGTATRLKTSIRALATQTVTVTDGLTRLAAKIRNIPGPILYDDFNAGTYNFTQGGTSPNAQWTNSYLGGIGATSGVRFSATAGSNVLYEKPQVSTSAGESHSTLNLSAVVGDWYDFDLTFRQRTVAQQRTGSAPNAWEVAWLIFRYTDDWHHYYFLIKPTGIEFGRKDYLPHVEQQMFLFTSGATTLTIGNWDTIRIKAVGNHFTIWINGVQKVNMIDNGTVGFDSQTSGLPPPPTAAMYHGKIGPYNEDAEVEFDDFQITPIPTINVAESLARIKGSIRALPTQTIAVAEASLTKQMAKIRTITQSIIVSDAATRLAAKIRALPTQTITVADAVARVLSIQPKQVVKTLTENITVAGGTIVIRLAKIRTISQSIIVSDVANRLSAKIRAIPTQTITVSEVIARTVIHGANNIVRVVPTQTVTVSDSITRKTAKIRAIPTQIVTVTDSIIKITGKVRALPTQTVTVTDAIARTVGYGLNLVRSLTQNITVGESLARRTTKTRAVPTQTVAITDSVVKSVGKIRTIAVQTVTIGESLTKRLAKTRIIAQVVSVIEQQIKIFKNGILVVPIQRPDKGGWFYKPPRIKQILYPVYIPTERERLKRRQKLREYPPLVIIPAFKYNINTVVAPFVVTNPVSQRVTVRFAITRKVDVIITYSGKAIPISLQPKQQQKRLNKARCASFIANQQALERYGRKINRLSRVMTLWSMAQRLFTSPD